MLDLHGDDAAIGRTYGELLRPELTDAYLPMMRQMIADVPAPFWSAVMAHDAHLPEFFSLEMGERAAALEAKLGLPAGEVRRYAWLSELGSIGPAVQVATSGIAQIDGSTGKPIGGCTSFVGQGPGGTLHARNVDFWGMGFWQKHATIVFVEPLTSKGQPDGYRYAQVSDVGEVFAGTTGINEPGLVVTTHLHLSRDVTLVDGRLHRSAIGLLLRARFGPKDQPQVSVLRVVETLLRRAASVQDALGLLADLRTAGAWSFVLSDRSGDSAVVGMNSRDVAVERGATLQTNFYPDAGMRSRELIPARGPVEGAQLRYARARALIDEGPLDVPRAIAILRDRFDLATGDERFASPNSVLSPDATQSIVFETPAVGSPTLWLATPHPDGLTPSALASFVAFPFDAGFDPAGCPDGCESRTLPYAPGPMDGAATQYAQAIFELADNHDPATALRMLRGIPGDDPGVHLVAAWLAASLGDFASATVELSLTRVQAVPPPRGRADDVRQAVVIEVTGGDRPAELGGERWTRDSSIGRGVRAGERAEPDQDLTRPYLLARQPHRQVVATVPVDVAGAAKHGRPEPIDHLEGVSGRRGLYAPGQRADQQRRAIVVGTRPHVTDAIAVHVSRADRRDGVQGRRCVRVDAAPVDRPRIQQAADEDVRDAVPVHIAKVGGR